MRDTDEVALLAPGDQAPDVELPDQGGAQRRIAGFWADGPLLLMFLRHLG